MNRKQRRAQGKGAAAPPPSANVEALLAEAAGYHRAGRLPDAELVLRRLLAAAPRHGAALHVLGVVCAQTGRAEEAVRLIEASLAAEPGNPAASFNLGNALSALGRDEAAAAAYRRSLQGRPGFAPAHQALGDALLGLGRPLDAAAEYRRALALNPTDAATCCKLGQALQDAGRLDEAAAAFRQALRLSLPNATAWVSLAGSLRELGENDDAITALDKALAIDPASARAWFVRSLVKTYAAGDAEIGRMEALLSEADARRMSADDRLDLEFALGKAWMDVGEPDPAFVHLDAGNRRMRSSFTYEVQDDVEALAEIARTYTPEFLARLAGAGVTSDRPVFVVGMPRSGTTLIEQILASHPDIHGAGELVLLDEAIGDTPGGDDRTPGALAAIGKAYVDGLAALSPADRRVVDKLPANFRHAGLIALAMPNARIIHCRRDAIDTCLSIYARKFVGRLDFAYDLAELGTYYRAYQDLMPHWRAVLPPDRFTEVDYEAVVGDLEGEARRLIDFVGLAWDDACLAFHQTRRDIRTASAAQARQPIYRTSIERWRPFEAHLGPLLEALGPLRGTP